MPNQTDKRIQGIIGGFSLIIMVLGMGAYFYLVLAKVPELELPSKTYASAVIDDQMKSDGYFDRTVLLGADKMSGIPETTINISSSFDNVGASSLVPVTTGTYSQQDLGKYDITKAEE